MKPGNPIDIIDIQLSFLDLIKLLGVPHFRLMANFVFSQPVNFAVSGKIEQNYSFFRPMLVIEGGQFDIINKKCAGFPNHIVIQLSIGVRALSPKFIFDSTRKGDTISVGNIFRSPEPQNILCLVEILSEKRQLP